MPSAAERSPSTPLSGRRMISRFTSPFTSKSRNVTDFAIEIDDPHKQYSPGDLVSGSVKLRVLKATRVTHVVVCLHGFVQVYKHPGSPGEGFRSTNGYLGSGRGKKAGEYYGNGFASLFEDEVVLCGDGRLAEGSYQFNFELEFPDRDLPSSIDFERGTISYMVTATLTRPTTMSPVTTCDTKVYFVERIDISPLDPPKPRTITLEPISKRSRARHQARKLVDPSERRSRKTNSATPSEQNRQSRASSAPSTVTAGDSALSPVPSVVSLDSGSSHRAASQPDTSSGRSPSSSDLAKSSLSSKTITTVVEPLAGGCLRGDYITVKVNISHTKPIRSLYGAIVTLYRQARVDMHPAIPIGPVEKGKKDKYEDYYPKSLTGLGGLSLSGAGSNHVFRKDLAQVMVPVYVDPSTLTAEVSAKVRVPEEAFPTISTVPGAMISFKYYTEVVVDIQGKLGNSDRTMGNLGATPSGPQLGDVDGASAQPAFSAFGSTIIDTTPLRRDKGVVCCTFEVVVGTRDSERRKGKRKIEVSYTPEQQQESKVTQDSSMPMHTPNAEDNSYYWYGHEGNPQDPHWYGQQQTYSARYHTAHPYPQEAASYGNEQYGEQPAPVPLPQMPDESQLSEKERMRLAEQRLLPSQPPGMDESETTYEQQATAPYLPEEYMDVHGRESSHFAGAHLPAAIHEDDETDALQSPSAPEYRPSESSSSAQAGNEMQDIRQSGSEGPAPQSEDATEHSLESQLPDASASSTREADDHASVTHDSHADAAGSSDLPRYER